MFTNSLIQVSDTFRVIAESILKHINNTRTKTICTEKVFENDHVETTKIMLPGLV